MAFPKKVRVFISVLLLSISVGGIFHLNRPESSKTLQTTDDAYVHADYTAIAPRISGTIDKVLIVDNQSVEAGQILATIDDREFAVAVVAAKAQVVSARASIALLEATLVRQDSLIREANAKLGADEAALALAKANRTRYQNLAADGSGTVQALQQAEAQLGIQLAKEHQSQAALLAARQQVDIVKADLLRAKGALASAHANQAAAELKLSYTRIKASIDGTIGQKSLRLGAFVHEGEALLSIVPLRAVFIEANFRETQLAHVQSGQAVDIKVDALPHELLRGTVESLAPASGVSYSAIAPHNASGNFTKIVQRIPVRISIDPGQPAMRKLRVGMSVTPTIHTGV